MPIEFRCTTCNKLLRTPDETGGHEAKCPACGEVMTVPTAGQSPVPGAPAFGYEPLGEASGYREDDEINPYQSPDEVMGEDSPFGPNWSVSGITPTRIVVGDVLAQTWTVFIDRWGMCMAVAVACFAMDVVTDRVGERFSQTLLLAAGPAGVLGRILINVTTQVFGIWINTGQAIFFIKTSRGRPAAFTDIFTGGPYLLRMIGAGILFALGMLAIVGVCMAPAGVLALAGGGGDAPVLAMLIGLPFAIIGFITFVLTFFPYCYLIIDQDMGVIDSLTEAYRVTSGNRLAALAIFVVTGVVCGFLTLITCLVGLSGVLPYMGVLYAVTYLLMIGQPTAGQRSAEPNQP